MIRKLTLGAGFAAGYLLGAKAGTARYDQLMGQLRGLAKLPGIKEASDGLQETAATIADRTRDTVNDKIEMLNDAVSPAATVDLTGGSPRPATTARTSTAPMAGASSSQTAPDVL